MTNARRIALQITGQVQGVGFRPFVLRLARRLGTSGFVHNLPGGVYAELEAVAPALEAFLQALRASAPVAARIDALEVTRLPVRGQCGFEIRDSRRGPAQLGLVPDLAMCPDCRAELRDPSDRRYRYPFITCAACGPRFSMAFELPYDRKRTSMRGFALCDACRREYEDPDDRRCHAQGIACAACGPRLWACDARGAVLAQGEHALQQAVAALDGGAILALKGLTGFQLLAAARSAPALARLRAGKVRPHKPFALMFADVSAVATCAELDAAAEAWLQSAQAPIVLLPRKRADDARIDAAVSSRSAWHGVLLPTTPLHQLLLDAHAAPLVVTSGNRGGEPLCRTEAEALARLGSVADLFLMHDREIVRALDDSVLRIAAGRALLLRRARGFAPRPLRLRAALGDGLATGGHAKNTLAISHARSLLVSAHVGDLDDPDTRERHRRLAQELPGLLGARPGFIASDAHPDYGSSASADELADGRSLPRVRVQHHLAHVLAVVAEHGLRGPLLGVAWDGSGFGHDGSLWGGECFVLEGRRARHLAQLRAFDLLGADRAAREPRRSALGVLRELYGAGFAADARCHALFPRFGLQASTLDALCGLLASGAHSARCSSVGRLFDAVASLLGLCQVSGFEAEAAIALEGTAREASTQGSVPALSVRLASAPQPDGPWQIDWGPMLSELLDLERCGVAVGVRALAFHRWLASSLAAVVRRAGLSRCVLSGGCFQNACLVEATLAGLGELGCEAYLPVELPPNDGALAAGQLYAAACGIELA